MSLFFFSNEDVTIYFLIYVDDINVVSSSETVVEKLLHKLRGDCALKDLGPLHYFLGIEVQYVPDGLHLSQTKYATDILSRMGILHCKSVATPLPVSEKLSQFQGDPQRRCHQIPQHCGCLVVLHPYSARYSLCCQQSMLVSSCSC